jgi:type IX secretion system PorP/SprF family membrane protein
MRCRTTYILTTFILSSCLKTMGQADINMATRWNNRATYNPAFIARPDYLYFYANTRKQWVGVDGAPLVFNIQASEYFNIVRSAFGLTLVSDKVGATQAINPMATYAFRIANKKKWALSMGLSAGILMRTLNGSLFEPDDAADPSISYASERTTTPDLNVGLEFQNTHFIYGISSTHLFSIGKSNTSLLDANHRYAYIIYKNDGPEFVSYTAGVQVVNRSNLTILEGNLSLRLKHLARLINASPLLKGPQESLDVGVTYRSSRQVALLAGIMITPYLRIGYAYDQSLFYSYSRNQTHEIMLEYRIPAKAASTVYRCGSKEFWYH